MKHKQKMHSCHYPHLARSQFHNKPETLAKIGLANVTVPMLEPQDVASAVAYAATTPETVAVHELVIRATSK